VKPSETRTTCAELAAKPAGSRAMKLRRWIGAFCALVYLLGGTEVLPQLLALGAAWEGSHVVRLARNSDGVTVLLSHERGAPQRPDYAPRHQEGNARHRHGPAASLICLFADRSLAQTDHVAQFGASQLSENSGTAKKAEANKALAAAPASLLLWFAPAIQVCAGTPLPPGRPPDSLRLLRSTVLVI
jgi:hypothetical protein